MGSVRLQVETGKTLIVGGFRELGATNEVTVLVADAGSGPIASESLAFEQIGD